MRVVNTRPPRNLDVLVVGAADRTALSERLVELEQDLGREINVKPTSVPTRSGGPALRARTVASPIRLTLSIA